MSIPLRLLIVEDSADDEAAVLIALKRASYAVTHERVETAETMSAALDRATWDVVLSDHDMPRFSSQGALRVTRERSPDMPFIIVSGNIGEDVVASAMRAGANDYVAKRDLSRLATAIERALRDRDERRERRRTEEALRESEERFTLAVHGSRDGIWDWNIAAGQVYFSARFKEMLGFGRDEPLQPEELFSHLSAADHKRWRHALVEHFKRRSPLDLEFSLTTRQHEPLWFCVRGQALWHEEKGKAIRIAGSLSDVTARRRAEAALLEQIEVIRRQQEAIRALSVPVIEVWEGVLAVPVLWELDRERAADIMDTLLEAVVRAGCRCAVLDLTGVASIDAATADHLVRIVAALRLLGAQGIIVGIRAEVANAIASLGLDLSSIPTLATLREALIHAMQLRRGVHYGG